MHARDRLYSQPSGRRLQELTACALSIDHTAVIPGGRQEVGPRVSQRHDLCSHQVSGPEAGVYLNLHTSGYPEQKLQRMLSQQQPWLRYVFMCTGLMCHQTGVTLSISVALTSCCLHSRLFYSCRRLQNVLLMADCVMPHHQAAVFQKHT